MRAKSIAVFLTVVFALIGVSVFQVDRALFSDQISMGEATARSQIAALIPAFQSEFKSVNEHFKVVAPQILGRPGDFSDAVSNRFEMVARLRLNNGTWLVESRAFHDKTRVKTWAENYTQIALKGIKSRDIPLGGTALAALLDPQRRFFFLWILRDEKDQWYSAITKPDVFQAIIDRQRGQTATIFLVNRTGQALGHTTPEYVGTVLRDDPVVADILRSGKKQGTGIFQDSAKNEVQGFYESIPGTNVLLVLTRPMSAMKDNRASVRLQIILMGGGLALVGLAAFFLFIKEAPPSRFAGASTATPPSPSTSPMSTQSSVSGPSATSADLMREKMKAYTTSASALAREMHGPLTRILSQTQLLKAKAVTDEEVTRIEELARDGRSVVLKLLSFAGEEEFRAEPTSMNEVLNRTLGILDSKLSAKGIKVEKNLKRLPEISAHPLALMKIYEALLNNAIEAMERMPNKVLTLSLETEGSWAVFQIKDTGEGLTPDKAAQVFDPFFTTKSPTVHSGLGLSTAFGLAREFGGEILFESQAAGGASGGQTTTVTLRFPMGVTASPSLTSGSSLSRNVPSLEPDLQPMNPVPSFASQAPPPALAKPALKPLMVPSAAPSIPAAPVAAAFDPIGAKPIPKPAPPGSKQLVPIEPPAPLFDDVELELSGEFATNTASLIQEKALQETLSVIDQVDVSPSPAAPQTKHPENTGFGKIDKPQFGPKKPAPRSVASGVTIRKPGERK